MFVLNVLFSFFFMSLFISDSFAISAEVTVLSGKYDVPFLIMTQLSQEHLEDFRTAFEKFSQKKGFSSIDDAK